MNKKQSIIYAVMLCITLLFGVYIGTTIVPDTTDTTTFYATVESINNNTVVVEGLDINDANGQGEYVFEITDTVKVLYNNESISLDKIKSGDNISITYTGEVLESSPAKLTNVLKICLLK